MILNSNKIKVVHVVSDLSIGGIQKVVLDIASSADLNKYSVTIYSLSSKLDLLDTYQLHPDIEIKTCNYLFEEDFSLISYIKNAILKSHVLKRASAVVDEIVKMKPEIVHLHIHPLELMLGVLIQDRTLCELVYTEHLRRFNDDGVKMKILRFVSRFIYRKFNIICVSTSIYDDFLKYKLHGIKKKIITIENKINLNFFKPTEKKKQDFISVVYIARIGYPKGHEDLIHAWSQINHSGLSKKLFLIGPDSLNNKIQNLAFDLKVSDSVVFMGPMYDVKDFLNDCDFAVFPSHKEGLPIALLEKMAMKLPVIVSDIKELTCIIEDNVNGLVFRCGNTVELSQKINLLADKIELRLALGEVARKTIESKYGTDNIAFANEQFYETVTANI